MTQYVEYIKGKKQYYEAIMNAQIIDKQNGGLKPHVFYPMVAARDDDDIFPVADVVQLPKENVLVCDDAGTPDLKELYVEGDWAYEVIITDGIPD